MVGQPSSQAGAAKGNVGIFSQVFVEVSCPLLPMV